MSQILWRSLGLGALGIAVLGAAGCQLGPSMPAVDTAREVSLVTGEPILFRVVGGLLDEPAELTAGSLTLGQAVRLTVRNDPRIQEVLWRVREAQADAQQTRLLPNPVLNVAVRLRSSGSAIIDASIGQELVSFFSRPARIGAADARLRASAAQAVTTTLDVVAELRGQFVAVQTAEALIPVLEERRTLSTRLLGVSEARLKAGEGTRADVLALQGQAVELEVEISEQRRDARVARLAIARLLGRPSDQATWPIAEPWPVSDAETQEADWISAAVDHRPEIAAAESELAAFGGDLKAARLLPWDGLAAGADSEREDGWSVGPAASVPLPLFDWGQAAKAKAQAGVAGAGHRLTSARRQVVMEVRQAFAERAAAADTLRRVENDLLPLVTRRREQAEDAYRSGLSGLAELLLADEELQTSRAKAIDLKRRYAEAQIRLERAAGGAAHARQAGPTTAATQTGNNP